MGCGKAMYKTINCRNRGRGYHTDRDVYISAASCFFFFASRVLVAARRRNTRVHCSYVSMQPLLLGAPRPTVIFLDDTLACRQRFLNESDRSLESAFSQWEYSHADCRRKIFSITFVCYTKKFGNKSFNLNNIIFIIFIAFILFVYLIKLKTNVTHD